jgi:hypothetical protein
LSHLEPFQLKTSVFVDGSRLPEGSEGIGSLSNSPSTLQHPSIGTSIACEQGRWLQIQVQCTSTNPTKDIVHMQLWSAEPSQCLPLQFLLEATVMLQCVSAFLNMLLGFAGLLMVDVCVCKTQ